MQGFKYFNLTKQQLSSKSQSKQLKIATLNYCGIMNNPYQFYSETYFNQLQQIGAIFDRLIHKYYKIEGQNSFSWQMGKIEQKLRLGRYSPSFQLLVGIQNNRFLNQNQFNERWNKQFNLMTDNNKQKYQNKHIQTTRMYDFIYYHTLLVYVYKIQQFNQLIQNNPNQYIQTLQKFYLQSFLNESKKLQKTKQNLFKIQADIIFIQQFSPLFEEFIRKQSQYFYKTDQTKDTIILVKKISISKITDVSLVLNQNQRKSLFWTDKTAIMIVDNLILINAHLSSKKQKNLPQIQDLKTTLLNLKKQIPNYHFILGGDLNSFLSPGGLFSSQFKMYPLKNNQYTTIKMRTFAQGQYDKSNKKVVEGKDKIISDCQIIDGKISTVDLKIAKQDSFIPSDDHPFDHFLVTCKVVVQ